MSARERDLTPIGATALARRHRDALRQRARRIRRSVAALAVTLFIGAFLVVYVQLASGHDPALVAAARRHAAATASATTSTGKSSSEASGEEASGASGASSAGEQASASALTTSQS